MRKSQIQETKALYSSKQRIVNPAVILPQTAADKTKKKAFFNSVINKLNINTSDKI